MGDYRGYKKMIILKISTAPYGALRYRGAVKMFLMSLKCRFLVSKCSLCFSASESCTLVEYKTARKIRDVKVLSWRCRKFWRRDGVITSNPAGVDFPNFLFKNKRTMQQWCSAKSRFLPQEGIETDSVLISVLWLMWFSFRSWDSCLGLCLFVLV